jgi:hypothetical protein
MPENPMRNKMDRRPSDQKVKASYELMSNTEKNSGRGNKKE